MALTCFCSNRTAIKSAFPNSFLLILGGDYKISEGENNTVINYFQESVS